MMNSSERELTVIELRRYLVHAGRRNVLVRA
jgi:hypothetical protein